MPVIVALIRSRDAAGNVVARLGLPLAYLEFLLAGAGRTRCWRLSNLKVFFTGAGKPPDAVTARSLS